MTLIYEKIIPTILTLAYMCGTIVSASGEELSSYGKKHQKYKLKV